MQRVKSIVLVYGARADGSSWSKLMPLLEARGFHVVSVEHSLKSIADDVAATNRIVNAQQGPVLLVGHSNGRSIVTEASVNTKVAGLVYVEDCALDREGAIFRTTITPAAWNAKPNWFVIATCDGSHLQMPGPATLEVADFIIEAAASIHAEPAITAIQRSPLLKLWHLLLKTGRCRLQVESEATI